MLRFNITLMDPGGFSHALAFAEAIDYMVACIRKLGYEAEATRNSIMADAHNVVLLAHFLNARQHAELPRTTIIFNGEQLGVADKTSPVNLVYKRLLASRFVWDYAAPNIAWIAHDRKAQIPFYYCSALARRDMRRTPGNTLLFYGAMTKRRQRLVDRLKSQGLKVVSLFDVYGDARDRHLFASRAVLNLHKATDTSWFEPIRCFYPLINGIPVISEPFDGDAMSDVFRDTMHVFESGTFAEETATLLRDPERFAADAGARIARFAATDPLPLFKAAIDKYLASL